MKVDRERGEARSTAEKKYLAMRKRKTVSTEKEWVTPRIGTAREQQLGTVYDCNPSQIKKNSGAKKPSSDYLRILEHLTSIMIMYL